MDGVMQPARKKGGERGLSLLVADVPLPSLFVVSFLLFFCCVVLVVSAAPTFISLNYTFLPGASLIFVFFPSPNSFGTRDAAVKLSRAK